MIERDALTQRLDVDGAKVLVLGLAVTGRAVARVLAAAGAWVLASELRGDVDPAQLRELDDAGVEIEVGSHDRAAGALGDVDLVLPSPGISPLRGILAEAIARGVRVAAELDLAQRLTDAVVVGVTGTKGKTTVCRLAARVATEQGLETYACGNTEVPFITEAAAHPDADAFVVEASSFGLCFVETFHPRVAVVTNLAPDHYDWHGTMEHYRAAKARIARRQHGQDLYMYPATQPELAALAPEPGPARLAFGEECEPGAWVTDDEVTVALDGRRLRARGAGSVAARGAHFAADVAAACAVGAFLGAKAEALEAALSSFVLDPHRMDLVGERDGVRFYDDSIATNPHAALASLRTFPSVVLIAGGRNKGLDLGTLAVEAARLRAVVAIGEAAPEIVGAFAATEVPVDTGASMEEAVGIAAHRARAGDVVLLAPACASHDAYRNYAERGDDFVQACRSLGIGM